MPPVPEDYPSSAVRHWQDACCLESQGRYDNAYYLSGYVVECALKAVLECEGLTSPRSFAHDLEDLGLRALHFLAQSTLQWNRYRPAWGAALQGWSPDVRYHPSGTSDGPAAIGALDAARIVLEQVLAPLMLDGHVPRVRVP